MIDLLSADEQEALRLTSALAAVCRRIVGNGPTAEQDWNEMALRIHGVQHMLMAQAAARAYPNDFRLMGNYREQA